MAVVIDVMMTMMKMLLPVVVVVGIEAVKVVM